MKIRATQHGMEMLMVRKHISRKEAYRLAQRAWDCGMKISEFTGGNRESMSCAVALHEDTSLRVYKGMRYVFSTSGVLITAYQDTRKPPRHYRRAHRESANYSNLSEYGKYMGIDLFSEWEEYTA